MDQTYYFDVFNGADLIRDHEGQKATDLREIRDAGEEVVREMAADAILRHARIAGRELRVRDQRGAVVFVLPFVGVL